MGRRVHIQQRVAGRRKRGQKIEQGVMSQGAVGTASRHAGKWREAAARCALQGRCRRWGWVVCV